MFCVTLCADLRKNVDPTIDIYIAMSSRAIHLTCCRNIGVKFLHILEISQEAFVRISYDTESGKIIDDIYYLNYHEISKICLFLFKKKKADNGAISYLLNFANNVLD